MDNGNNEFRFTYVAPTEQERKEVSDIKRRYEMAKEGGENTLTLIRRLDAKVKNIPTIISLILGVVGTLIFGTGLALVLEFDMFLAGIIAAAVGILPLAAAYPVFLYTTKRLKAKYGPRILELSDEVLNNK